MKGKALVLGGYGNFGKRIASALVRSGVPVVIAGRDLARATSFAATLPYGLAEPAAFDAQADLAPHLARINPAVVVHTCGPFQTSDYRIAQACNRCGCPCHRSR